jgi:glycosyltransferase involved in cell wall biosynthesis
LSDVFKRLAKIRKFKLIVIGNFQCEMDGVDVEMIQWTKEKEVSDLQKIDIGVYPLPPAEWVMGKSGLKALQYMAIGIPTVATDVGTIGRIIEDKVSGLLVKTDEEWIQALTLLLDSPQKRVQLGKAGREIVEQKFSILVTREVYLKVLDEVTHN